MSIEIRPERSGDAKLIHEVVTQAFRDAPHTSGTEGFIVRELRAAGALAVSLVALEDGHMVGHVALSPVTIEDGSAGWYGLGPVAVLPGHQGRGIGSELIGHALRLLRERGAAGCVVLGEPAYYGRFGFRHDPALVLEGVPPEYFQALPLGSAAARGAVAYHPAFAATR